MCKKKRNIKKYYTPKTHNNRYFFPRGRTKKKKKSVPSNAKLIITKKYTRDIRGIGKSNLLRRTNRVQTESAARRGEFECSSLHYPWGRTRDRRGDIGRNVYEYLFVFNKLLYQMFKRHHGLDMISCVFFFDVAFFNCRSFLYF